MQLSGKIKLMQGDGSFDRFVQLSSVIAPSVVIGRDGELVTSYILKGIAFETVDDIEIDQAVNNLNILYRAIARNDYAVQVHRLRRPMQDSLTPCAEHGFAHDLSQKYNEKIGLEKLGA